MKSAAGGLPACAAPLAARPAYDLAAAEFDQWPWQDFWHRTEAPIVLAWLAAHAGRRLLDLGSGTGYYMAHLAAQQFACTGLDVSAAMLGFSARRLAGAAAHVQGRAESLPFGAGTFDQLLMTRVMSHIADERAVFREAHRVLAPGGQFVLSDIDPAHAYERTELPFRGRKIQVETFKRRLHALAGVASREAGLDCVGHEAICDASGEALAFVAKFKK